MVATAMAGVLFAALRYDLGTRGYALFVAASAGFAGSALAASRCEGRARVAALAVAALSGLAGWAVFLLFGTR
jgi:hypothetical protein